MKATCSIVGIAMVAWAALGAGARAQEHPFDPSHAGSWDGTAPITPSKPDPFAAADLAAATATANDLVAVLKPMPELAPPPGFQVTRHASTMLQNLDHSRGPRPAFLTLYLIVGLAPYEHMDAGVQANGRDAATIEIRVNTLEPLLGSQMGLSDAEGEFMKDPPEAVDTVHGAPVFEAGNGQRWTLLRRNAVPFFAPVTVERYLRATIAADQHELDQAKERRARIPAGMPASELAAVDDGIAALTRRVANDQHALAGMSAADRARPARVHDRSDEDAPTFGGPDDGDAAAIMYLNPALMSADLPRTAPQILSVCIGGNVDLWPGMADRLNQHVDWAALDRYVHRRP